MRKYHKRFKKCHIFKRKRSKLINKNKTYFDKLYIRIFLSSLLLLALLGSKNLLKLTIFDNINNNINILPIINLFTKKKINPMVGAAGISAFPMASRIVHQMGVKEDKSNYLLMHAASANIAGQVASAIAGGIVLTLFL